MQDVHLQTLLAVALAIICFCLVIGLCICWRRMKSLPSDEKEVGFSSPSAPVDLVTVNLNSCPSINILPVKQQYEELEGDVFAYPSQDSSLSPSDDDANALSHTSPEAVGPQKPQLPLRRLSSPVVPTSSSTKIVRSRASLPSIRRLSLVVKKNRLTERRSTVTSDSCLYTESSRLTGTADLSSPSSPQGELQPSQYGSGSGPTQGKQLPSLHFTSFFSPAKSTLTVAITGVFRASRRVSGAVVRASLPLPCPGSLQVAPKRRQSLSAEPQPQVFTLQAGSLEKLQACRLLLAAFCKDFSGLRETSLGELELVCSDVEWKPDTTITYQRQLTRRLRKSTSSQSLGVRRASTCDPRSLGQLFILLQYQSQAHRIKVMLRKAEGLAKLTKMPGAPNYHVVINLRHGGKVISTKETKRASGPNAVWNAPFLFDLPAGDITRLPLVLEFIVVQGRLYMKSTALGHVLIGYEGPEAGQQHWQEMYNRGQMETVRWHALQSNTP
ncbi:synaptotagmin-11 isoform X1 [Electrophorus electricus]|uniref:synaptotagmin-11 isoform X1 n=2 Tax=Electrophorus electricus TaxID=8005 RepID=UPI0015D00EBA|nr:synaptotagmin-11 isoform X1 [Electrophorus electricus]